MSGETVGTRTRTMKQTGWNAEANLCTAGVRRTSKRFHCDFAGLEWNMKLLDARWAVVLVVFPTSLE